MKYPMRSNLPPPLAQTTPLPRPAVMQQPPSQFETSRKAAEADYPGYKAEPVEDGDFNLENDAYHYS